MTLVLAACGDDDDATATTAPDAPAAAPTGSAAAGNLRLAPVGRFDSPVYVAGAPGDTRRLFVVEQGGTIRVVRGGRVLAQPFLDISRLVTSGGEQGLLSVAFPPSYQRSGLFYVYYTDTSGQQRIVEYRRANADRANAGSARLVLRMADPEANHNGGLMVFGRDKRMYVGTGDGGGGDDQHGARGNAQNLRSLLGKILRLNPRARPARPEIYSYGLRNPWRFSFDRVTNDLTIADVGQDAVEEVNFVRAGRGKGANFGWRPFEGKRRNFDEPAPGHVPPVIEQSHDDGWCSITGGYVVRDRGVAALYGRYVYGDFCVGRLRAARLRAGGASGDRELALPKVESLSSFGEDTRGRVYVVSLSGPVYRLAQ
ncbi:MAG TPA: PQQ-dependent sugar dehydrogenase [Solirubrobacteraceae bacterium]